MISGMVRLAVQMLVLSAMLYGAFFVPIGRHTLYRHAVRICGTAEARELGDAVGTLFVAAKERLATRN